jgi:hypothetical protein
MLKLMSTIKYNPGSFVRIKKSNNFGIVLSLHEEGQFSYTYNILPLTTSKWKVIRGIQIFIIKKVLNQK